MAYTFALTRAVNVGGGQSISKRTSYDGDAREGREIAVADSATDFEVNFVLDVSQIKGLYIVSDQDILLETNSGGSPTDTISLVAGEPLIWHTGSYYTCPFSADITANIFFTNASGSAATVNIEVVHDSTP